MNYNAKDLLAQRELRDEGFYKDVLDGLWGERSRQALAAWEAVQAGPATPKGTEKPSTGQFDIRTETNIATLLPKARDAARKFMEAADPFARSRGLIVKITGGTRTYAEQDALYAQGRTTPGPVVTKAPAGYSAHNFGIAWDIVLFDTAGKPVWESPVYRELALIGDAQGLDCGALWKGFRDEPHYNLKTGMTLAQMRAFKAEGKPIT